MQHVDQCIFKQHSNQLNCLLFTATLLSSHSCTFSADKANKCNDRCEQQTAVKWNNVQSSTYIALNLRPTFPLLSAFYPISLGANSLANKIASILQFVLVSFIDSHIFLLVFLVNSHYMCLAPFSKHNIHTT